MGTTFEFRTALRTAIGESAVNRIVGGADRVDPSMAVVR
jgi:hypothetical protein